MLTPLECLPDDAWQPLLEGDVLPAELQDCYERHLESCPACQERLDQESAGDSLLLVGQRVGDPTRLPDDPPLSRFLERLQETFLAEFPRAETDDLFFLQPGNQPGVPGMLGDFQVLEVIGRGGMGIVLKAFEPSLERIVAIKVLTPALAGSLEARRRFAREARAAAAVSHEHIVAIHAVSEEAGLPYLVMPYINGESLQARLDRSGPLGVEEVVGIALQVALGLAAAHAQGLVHRDIKPANILLQDFATEATEDTERKKDASPSSVANFLVKITDFGLARMVDDVGLTRQGVVAGTPEYMAPEQARGEAVDQRGDLFSLGCVLYAMCTGRPPFQAATTMGVLRKVSEETPISPRTLNSTIPVWLESLTVRLLAKQPAERFQRADDVASLLAGYLAHLRQPTSVPAPRLPDPPASKQGTGRWRRVLFSLVVALFMLLFGLGLLPFWLAGGMAANAAEDGNEAMAPTRLLQGHTGPVHDVRFLPEGKLVSASGWPHGDHTWRVWDLGTGQERGRLITPGETHSLDVTADGQYALAGLNNGQVLLVELGTMKIVRVLKGHAAAVDWVRFGPRNRSVFSASVDGTARRWDLETGLPQQSFRVAGKWARSGAIFPDGRRLLTGTEAGLLQIWNIETGQEVKRFNMAGAWMIDSLAVSADGRRALIAGVAGLRVYDVESAEEIRHFQANHDEVYHAALSPDGRRLLTGSFDGKVRLWDHETGQLLGVLGSHEGFVFSVAFSADADLAASGGGGECKETGCIAGTDHAIRIYDLSKWTGAPVAPVDRVRQRWLVGGALLGVTSGSLLGLWWFVRRARPGAREQAPVEVATRVSLCCGQCKRKLEVKAALCGKKVRCPGCGEVLVVPRDAILS